MGRVRVAILGQGRSGWLIHGSHFRKDGDRFQVAAVVDPIPDRRRRAVEAFGCDAYESHWPLLQRNDIDLVVNCTPSHLHVPITEEFLRAGFDVLCEKPLARRAAEVDTLLEAAAGPGSRLFIFQQSRYSAGFRKIREVVDSGVLGRIVQVSIAFNGFARRWDWQTVQRFHGGSLLNTGPHPLDQALELFGGSGMPHVFCRMDRANTFGDAEDYVKLLLTGPDSPVVDLEISSCCAFPASTYGVQGTRGGLKGTMDEVEWKYYLPEETEPRALVREPLTSDDGLPAYCVETLAWHAERWSAAEERKDESGVFGDMTGRFYAMLHRTLTEGAPLEVTPEQVRRQIAVIEECHRQNPLDTWA